MKASYVWRSGPLERQQIVRERVQRVEIGGPEFPIPGAAGLWVVVEYEKGRCYLTNRGEPLTITRKVSGQLQTLEVKSGDRVENKSNDILAFGSGGPRLLCDYELDLVDKVDLPTQGLDEAMSPVSEDHRRQRVLSKNVASQTDVRKVVDTVRKEGRLWRGKLAALGVAGVLFAVALGALTIFLFHEAEAKVFNLAQAVSTSQADYQENLRRLAVSQTEARQLLDEARRLERDLKPGDPALAELREQIEALRLELRESSPLEAAFIELQKKVDSSLFLIACRVRASQRIFKDEYGKMTDWYEATGTGFTIDTEGTLVTCKHVVQPWKYAEMSALLTKFGAKVVESRIEAFPVGYKFVRERDEVASTAYTAANGRLKLLSTAPDSMVTRRVEVNNMQVTCEFESGYDNDVAVIKLDLPGSTALPLATEAEFEKIRDKKILPVMVAGFPLGIRVMENGKIESSVTLGNVRKIERLIQHTAPTCGGNSGGPLLDRQGRVIGIVSFVMGGERTQNLNVCVPISAVRACLSRPQ